MLFSEPSTGKQVLDMLGICMFNGACGDPELLTRAYNALTGLTTDRQKLFRAGQRFLNLMRVYALINGKTKEDDSISPRYLTTPGRGTNAGKSLGDYLPRVLQNYYQLAGWTEEGVPTRETLERLDLPYAADALEKYGVKVT